MNPGSREYESLLKEAHGSGKVWCCRFHPTDWWHEIGCPHKVWTEQQLRDGGYGHLIDQIQSAERDRLTRERG